MTDWGALGDDPRVVYQDEHVILICARWQDVWLPMVDAVITDPPYSERTHAGHNDGEEQKRGVTGQPIRQSIDYECMTKRDAEFLVDRMAKACRGWIAIMTDDELVPAIKAAYRDAGRYAFAPVTAIQKRFRALGDGPGSWTIYISVSRPRSVEFSRWGCLPGSYSAPTEKIPGIVGAKPLSLLQALVRDYSREGDLILDPCAGSGTTLRAAKDLGRRAIGIEMDRATCQIAARRLRPHRAWQQELTL